MGATESILSMSDKDISERTRQCVNDVVERGKFHFEDKEHFGEYMQVLQRANQSIFMDQKKLLQRIKDAKKAATATQIPANEKATCPEGAVDDGTVSATFGVAGA